MLSTLKSSTTSWKQQAVRMTSSCHKVFYVSLRVLALSIALCTKASQRSLLCDFALSQEKKEKVKGLMFNDLYMVRKELHNHTSMEVL